MNCRRLRRLFQLPPAAFGPSHFDSGWGADHAFNHHHDLLLEGGKPVEVKDEEVKAKKSKIPEDANGYYAVLRDGEEKGDGSESDSSEEHHDDSSGDGANTNSSSDGGNSSSEGDDVDFNRNFNSATLEPGPSQRELQHAEEATKAAAEKEKQKVDSARMKDSWGLQEGEKIRILDYKGEQEVWATSAQPDGSLVQVELQDGQFVVVAEELDWSGARQVKITQHLTLGSDDSGYLKCDNDGDEAPCGWYVAPDAVGLLPHEGQCGYIAALDGAGDATDTCVYYHPGFDTDICMGCVEAFRDVHALGMAQKGVYRKSDARKWWVLVVDAHPSAF